MPPSSDKPAAKRFDSPEQEAYLHLWRTYDRLKALEERLFQQYDLSPQQYNALRLLRAAQPDTIPTLALGARLISRAPDMTRLLDRLEERQLVERQRRPENRRVVEVGITATGIELLDKLDEQVRQCNHEQLGHLSKQSLAQLVALLAEARQPHETPDQPWP
ncbi:transcriptional regulator SlyA [Anatilimnocola aggregata]|uniref:Transcriptional regulator SlyA n=2 Tax=Anatilimnocola aggregata TaxID=2528021 RepID=A0A517Y872_9BACT|nr:transcriptional regulator SlyA [Anatilimnocola aggregata]